MSIHTVKLTCTLGDWRLESLREAALAFLPPAPCISSSIRALPSHFLFFSCLWALKITLADERGQSEIDSEVFTKQNFSKEGKGQKLKLTEQEVNSKVWGKKET